MSFKSSSGRSVGKLLNVFQSTKTILGQGIGGGGGAAAAVFSATGGTLVQSGGYNYHVFTQPDTFSVTTAGSGVTMTSLVVGGGGNKSYGFGGAGGVVKYTFTISSNSTLNTPVTVGSGGGNPSQINVGTAITAFGGGQGGVSNLPTFIPQVNGQPGGSGGGGGLWYSGSFQYAPGGQAVLVDTNFSNGVGIVTYYQGTPGSGGPNAPGGGAGGGRSGANIYDAAPFPEFSAPIIEPAIPAPVRPSWTPLVGPTGLYGRGGTTGGPYNINFTGNGGGPGGSTGGSGIVIIRYLTP